MPVMPQDRLALDRVPASARTITADGHMRVTGSAVSKSNVCNYLGSEIPGYETLGLDARKEYRLYRDPAELERAADSLNGKPLLVIHRPVTAGDHAPEIVVGALDNAQWAAPYLRADLTIWSQDAIDLVDSGEQRELSCAYRYVPVMQAGMTGDGERYDGVMTAIDFNHCALVADGRAGPDVHVGDSKEFLSMAKTAAFSRQALFASGAMRAYLVPKLAKDAKLDLAPMFATVTAKTWKSDKPKLKLALDAAIAKDKALLAKDADIADVVAMLDQLEELADEEAPAQDEEAETEEEKKARLEKRAADKAAKDEFPPKKDDDKDEKKDKPAMDAAVSKVAMDAAILASVTKAQAETRAATIADMRAMQEAERAVRPYVGELVIACDSANQVYKLALDLGGIDLTGVPEAAYGAMVKMLPKPGESAKPRLAMDAIAGEEAKFRAAYPGASRLIRS